MGELELSGRSGGCREDIFPSRSMWSCNVREGWTEKTGDGMQDEYGTLGGSAALEDQAGSELIQQSSKYRGLAAREAAKESREDVTKASCTMDKELLDFYFNGNL